MHWLKYFIGTGLMNFCKQTNSRKKRSKKKEKLKLSYWSFYACGSRIDTFKEAFEDAFVGYEIFLTLAVGLWELFDSRNEHRDNKRQYQRWISESRFAKVKPD